MLQYDFENSLGYWLTTTHQSYMRLFNERLAPHGITFRQAQLLGWLAIDGPMSQTELAARMLVEPPSLVGILDRAEQAKLIERRPCPNDRRVKQIHALPSAKKTWKQIAEVGREIRKQAMEGLTENEIRTLQRLLVKVRENVSPQTADTR
ncbi:MarR family winged helix-turn-helix transcriptional regulator [Aeoliella mucimassa]|uniref:Transcriptional regulator SlyA n=1 Tax=Aeoliella mucimassa TaxID=2527972 RepID=A0A518AR32_9BACT|nr:MarR family transcriptional regulator [Aeoliella mucimassa]QDU57176.1 Transcriptional regulator SlyA [Aeoliella mucimassa]